MSSARHGVDFGFSSQVKFVKSSISVVKERDRCSIGRDPSRWVSLFSARVHKGMSSSLGIIG